MFAEPAFQVLKNFAWALASAVGRKLTWKKCTNDDDRTQNKNSHLNKQQEALVEGLGRSFKASFHFFFFFFNVSFFCRSYSRQFIALNSTFQKLKINWRNWRLNVAYGTCHPLLVKLRKVGVTAGNTLVPRIINYLLYYSTWVVLKDILMTFVSFHYCNYLKLWDVLKHVFNVNFSNCVACVFQTYRRQMAKLLKRFPYIRALQI